MIEALWSVEFLSNMGSHGMGVVVIETGRVLGGDSAFLYVGDVQVENGKTVHANIKVTKYNFKTDMESVFGPLKEFTLKVQGPLHDTQIVFAGHVAERPDMRIQVRAVRRAELP